MSRWNNKNRVHSFAFPLDSLAKEKENTNRPVAARSAGTVGKWGTTSFTSIRTPSYGYVAYTSQEALNPNTSPLSADASSHTPFTYPVSDTPKPRKFFKSRNTVAAVDPPAFLPSPNAHQSAASFNTSPYGAGSSVAHSPAYPVETAPQAHKQAPKIRLKINKKQLAAAAIGGTNPFAPDSDGARNQAPVATKAAKPHKPAKMKKPPKPVKEKPVKAVKPAKPVAEPTRKISRARKTVNYTENRSRSPTPVRSLVVKTSPEVAEVEEPSFVGGENEPAVSDDEELFDSSAEELHDKEHPPIVLRISRGTAQLIRTDSDEPDSAHRVTPSPKATIPTTEELLAVLTDDTPYAPPEPPVPNAPLEPVPLSIRPPSPPPIAITEPQPPEPTPAVVIPTSPRRPHSIKIKIKTNYARMICEAELAARNQILETTIIVPPVLASASPVPVDPIPESTPAVAAPPAKRSTRSRASPTTQPQTVPPTIPSLIAKVPVVASPVKEMEEVPPEEEEELETPAFDLPDSDPLLLKSTATIATRRAGRRAVKSPVASAPNPPNTKTTRQTRKTAAQPSSSPPEPPAQPDIVIRPPIIKSYTRKRKLLEPIVESPAPIVAEVSHPTVEATPPEKMETGEVSADSSSARYLDHSAENNNSMDDIPAPPMDLSKAKTADDGSSVPKLVISKKKGSIFKSRATETAAAGADTTKAKRHQLYRHKWDQDADNTEENNRSAPAGSTTASTTKQAASGSAESFDIDDDIDHTMGTLTKVMRPRVSPTDFRAGADDLSDEGRSTVTSVHCDSKAKPYYTVIRNVKKAHQMQEIGEFQEMDDDVHYILDALQSHNPLSTRCLSAIQLASKCMTPAFRMHVRAHGIVQSFFKALEDAQHNQSLALCTATVMFVLNQDYSNMDLDRDSLCLMLNLLESDATHQNALDDCSLTQEQLKRIREKVTEICTVIKPQGKAVGLSPDNITVGTLAMETLLSLTSKRAGEWFKEELRNLGGLEKILSTISECFEQIAGSDYSSVWTPPLLDQMRKVSRCLTVLENVSSQNDDNQAYTLAYRDGLIVDLLLRFYQMCSQQIELYPTDPSSPKDGTGSVLYEALKPTLNVLIHLTHSAASKEMVGAKPIVYQTSLRLMFQAEHCVPEPDIVCVFILSLLVSLTTHNSSNGKVIMESRTPKGVGKEYDQNSAIKAIIHFFNKYLRMAEQVDRSTDEMLDNKTKAEQTEKSAGVVVVDTLVKNSRTHMEHTIVASYVSLLVGQLIIDSKPYQMRIRKLLPNNSFAPMVAALEKYYELMNLTATSEAATVAHMKNTQRIIKFLEMCDKHSDYDQPDEDNDFDLAPTLRRTDGPQHQYRSMRNSSSVAGGSSATATTSGPATYSSRYGR